MNRVSARTVLSPRQAQVFELLEQGLLVKQIADRLAISTNTTKKHLQKIYRKCQARSAREAIHFCRPNPRTAPQPILASTTATPHKESIRPPVGANLVANPAWLA
ncbi:MAG: helix-turn-helix transcriptional regulator [Verrucomicrobia subdivision 3 bacterium]|nr:helix-turn-helix transcriptional regulator [Limisphaerales bacterium]